MEAVAGLSEMASQRGYAASLRVARQIIRGNEHQILVLPPGFVRPDGSLDLYEDVRRYFRPVFDNGRAAIQCGGWIGYVPLNDEFALEINPRVPIGNLERLIGMAGIYAPRILERHTRLFGHSAERPDSLFDVVADQMLAAFDKVWDAGLLKAYKEESRIGTSPTGRVRVFESVWRTEKAGKPMAVSSSFQRTVDIAPNRLIRMALIKLLYRYLGEKGEGGRARVLRLRKAVDRLKGVGDPSGSDLALRSLEVNIRHLPSNHEHYVDALMLAQLIIFEAGFAIRSASGAITLPSILIDMSDVFEAYVRRVLINHVKVEGRTVTVKDGNHGGPAGAKLALLDPVEPGVKNVPVTPDIVIEVDGTAKLVIDTKYKPAPTTPSRDDVNQVVTYGARYGVEQVMLLHAGREPNHSVCSRLGKIGQFAVFNAMINLSAEPMESEERLLGQAISDLLWVPPVP